MAVSGKTTGFEVPYLAETDIPDMGAGDKAIAERVNAILTGVKGDATLATDGTLSVKDHSVSTYQNTAVTRTTTSLGAFSTPIAVTLPKVKANQLIEIMAFGAVKDSVESTGSGGVGGVLGFSGSVGVGWTQEQNIGTLASGGHLAANSSRSFATVGAGGSTGAALFIGSGFGQLGRGFLMGQGIPPAANCFVAAEDSENFKIELVGATTSGTLTVEAVWLMARLAG